MINLSQNEFHWIVVAWIALALVLIPLQLFITAPFGRHTSFNWGPVMDNRTGWIIMELVSLIALWSSFYFSGATSSLPVWILLGLWSAHYLNRSLIYPFRIRTQAKKIPLFIVASAIFFNSFNGWSNGTYFGAGWGDYTSDWLFDPRFIGGLGLMVIGATINIRADNILLRLRGSTDTGYQIPRGGLFEKISCPNFLGEIIEWTGFAIACWNLPALGFAVWTAANLIPRALSHHRWYKQEFDDYPASRRALIPAIL